MRCPKCGFDNNENAKTCAKCGAFIDPYAEEKKRHRKVVQLPSNQSSDEATPIESMTKARAAQRAVASGSSSDKTPTPRRRSSAAGNTAKIPAVKRPAHEDGKIPVDQRRPQGDAAHGAQDEGAPARTVRTKQVIIDDAVLAAEGATQTRAARPSRDRQYAANDRRAQRKGSNTTRTLIIGVAILLLLCLIALGIFLVNTGSDSKTVQFDTDGGTVIGNQYVLPDSELAQPANPTRPGYSFDGWYLDPDYSEEAQFPIDVTQDMTLYAKWKQDRETSSSGVPSTITTAPPEPDDANASSSSGSDASSTGNAAGNATGNSSASGNQGTSGGSGAGSGSGNSGAVQPSAPSSGGSSGGGSSLNSNPASNGDVSITLTAANGTKLTGTVTLHDGYVIPDSSKKAYTVAELKALGLNDAELCIARNEPYARQGYSFRNPGLQAYFNARSWYHNKGWRGQLPENSAGYITAHNLLKIAKESPSASKWLKLRMN